MDVSGRLGLNNLVVGVDLFGDTLLGGSASRTTACRVLLIRRFSRRMPDEGMAGWFGKDTIVDGSGRLGLDNLVVGVEWFGNALLGGSTSRTTVKIGSCRLVYGQ